MPQAINSCPRGWHLPTQQEWEDFFNAYGGKDSVGDMIKKNSGSKYKSVDGTERYWGSAAPEIGFNALPAGSVSKSQNGMFFGGYGNFIGNGVSISVNYNMKMVGISTQPLERYYSIRCIKDEKE